jgi:hypothetical protein
MHKDGSLDAFECARLYKKAFGRGFDADNKLADVVRWRLIDLSMQVEPVVFRVTDKLLKKVGRS